MYEGKASRCRKGRVALSTSASPCDLSVHWCLWEVMGESAVLSSKQAWAAETPSKGHNHPVAITTKRIWP